jgi:hypothetical protein
MLAAFIPNNELASLFEACLGKNNKRHHYEEIRAGGLQDS